MHSKRKGAVGERLAAESVREHWGPAYREARRGVQYKGGPDSPDLAELPGIHAEVKVRKALSVAKFMDQAQDEAADEDVPVVLMKAWRTGWFVMIRIEDTLAFARLQLQSGPDAVPGGGGNLDAPGPCGRVHDSNGNDDEGT